RPPGIVERGHRRVMVAGGLCPVVAEAIPDMQTRATEELAVHGHFALGGNVGGPGRIPPYLCWIGGAVWLRPQENEWRMMDAKEGRKGWAWAFHSRSIACGLCQNRATEELAADRGLPISGPNHSTSPKWARFSPLV